MPPLRVISLISLIKPYTKFHPQKILILCGFPRYPLDKKAVVDGQKGGSFRTKRR